MDIYTQRSIRRLAKFLATALATYAAAAALIMLIGFQEAGILFTAVAIVYLCYHFVITDAEQSRTLDNLNSKYSKKD